MNFINRLLASLGLLAGLVLAAAWAAAPTATLTWASAQLDAMRRLLESLGSWPSVPFLIWRAAIPAVLALICAALLWAEWRTSRPRTVRVHTAAGSVARVATESVERRLAWRVAQLADVVSAAPRVTSGGRSVNVLLDVVTGPNIDVPMKTDEVVAVTREVIIERMGLQAGKIEVRIKHAPFDERT
jgi:hypothetical protein